MSASLYSLKTSSVDLSEPLRIVGSSVRSVSLYRKAGTSRRTRYDCQLAPQIRKPNSSNINAVNQNAPLCGFYKTEERQCQRAFTRARTAQYTDLLSRIYLEIEIMQHGWEVRLYETYEPCAMQWKSESIPHNG